jgi:hypothetical protein
VSPAALEAHNRERLLLTRHAMLVLGGWALLNIGAGTAGALAVGPERPQLQAFLAGSAAWNGVNLAIAGLSLWSNLRTDPARLSLAETLAEGQQLQGLLLLNAGLDVAYLAAGAWLWERGLRTGGPRLVGFGQALLLQGGFLLLFDVALALLHGHLASRLLTPVTVEGASLTLRF